MMGRVATSSTVRPARSGPALADASGYDDDDEDDDGDTGNIS
jgi:hypothetical protein